MIFWFGALALGDLLFGFLGGEVARFFLADLWFPCFLHRILDSPHPPTNRKKWKNQKPSKLLKNQGFGRNGRHHEVRTEKLVRFEPIYVDFRATATRFVNIFIF